MFSPFGYYDKATVNLHVQVFCDTCFLFSLGYIPTSGIAGVIW